MFADTLIEKEDQRYQNRFGDFSVQSEDEMIQSCSKKPLVQNEIGSSSRLFDFGHDDSLGNFVLLVALMIDVERSEEFGDEALVSSEERTLHAVDVVANPVDPNEFDGGGLIDDFRESDESVADEIVLQGVEEFFEATRARAVEFERLGLGRSVVSQNGPVGGCRISAHVSKCRAACVFVFKQQIEGFRGGARGRLAEIRGTTVRGGRGGGASTDGSGARGGERLVGGWGRARWCCVRSRGRTGNLSSTRFIQNVHFRA